MRTRASLIGLGLALLAMSAAAQTTVTSSGTTATTGNVPYVSASTSTSTTVSPSPITVSGSNVGIGMTSPTTALQVNGTVTATGLSSSGLNVNSTVAGAIAGYFNSATVDSNIVLQGDNSQAYWITGGNNILKIGGNGGNEPASGAINVLWNGNVGIGTTNPGAKLEVSGSLKLTANSGGAITFQDGTTQSTAYTGVTCGGDYAESVDVTGSRTNYEPGDVLVIDPDVSGKFLKSADPYSTSVSGIYSTKPGTVGRRQTTAKSPDEVPMAVVGIVPAKVSAENGPIKRGDLLVSSSKIGYAMKGTDRSRLVGAVIGKAMGNLDTGTGVIEVLVTLQ